MNSKPSVVCNASSVPEAVTALRNGELVGMPTETVYGLAADASNPEAVARVFASKGRPSFNPLISHVANVDAAAREGGFDDRAIALADALWPGSLTIVVPIADTARTCELARAGLSTIGLRVPRHPLALELLDAFDGPLSAPSANLSGRLSPTQAEDVAHELGDLVAMVLDGGPCQAGIESTIIALSPDEPARLLRPGAIGRDTIEAIVGPLAEPVRDRISAPGQLASHYAPRAKLRLEAAHAEPREVLLGFGPDAPTSAANLSAAGDTVEAAANLYRLLRELDASAAKTIAVMPIPNEGLGEAINDRLRRAAAPRPGIE